jgi:16S rRNA (cytosine1402-N4)-methyltransferase
MQFNIEHQPVLLEEALSVLQIRPGGVYVDGTFGQGGHTQGILNQLGDSGYLLSLDKDPEAARYAQFKYKHNACFQLCQASFSQLKEYAIQYSIAGKINGILLDLGTSSTQLDQPERGFSFYKEGPLDMRMDPTQGKPASDWIAKASIEEMASIFKEYGEERWAKRIALAIDQERKRQPIETTLHLAHIVKQAHPRWTHRIHPATRVFQAIRIYINQELKELAQCLSQSIEVLAPGGRLAIITFHSLEAREVKHFVRSNISAYSDNPTIRWQHTGIKPSAEEISTNPRARSAILRVIEKIK